MDWARHGCWWLQNAWDALVPNALLSVSVFMARPPHPACASGTWKAPWWAAPSQDRLAVRTQPPLERPTPARLPGRALSLFLDTNRGFERRSCRQFPRCQEPPERNQQLAGEGHNPDPPPPATALAKARLIPL